MLPVLASREVRHGSQLGNRFEFGYTDVHSLPPLSLTEEGKTCFVALVWSDTQRCEGDVIESGASLVEAGVPFFVELWRDTRR